MEKTGRNHRPVSVAETLAPRPAQIDSLCNLAGFAENVMEFHVHIASPLEAAASSGDAADHCTNMRVSIVMGIPQMGGL